MANRIPSPLTLETERLLIRSPRVEDGKGLREAIAESISELRMWMPWATSVPSVEEATANCEKAMKEFEAGRDHRLHLILKESMTFVGSSGLHRIDWDAPKADIGYWVRRAYRGNGYITEAVREITRFALQDLGMNRVQIVVSSENQKSRAVPVRLGYTLEGTLKNETRHMDGSLRDTCVYAIYPE